MYISVFLFVALLVVAVLIVGLLAAAVAFRSAAKHHDGVEPL